MILLVIVLAILAFVVAMVFLFLPLGYLLTGDWFASERRWSSWLAPKDNTLHALMYLVIAAALLLVAFVGLPALAHALT